MWASVDDSVLNKKSLLLMNHQFAGNLDMLRDRGIIFLFDNLE